MARIWSNLGESTRTRYERAGITAREYESGASLKGARGHSQTPERPMSGQDRPENQSYYALRNDIRELRKELYGSRPKFVNSFPKGSRKHLETLREILEAKIDFNGSWDEFWDANDQWDRDDFADAEKYH